MGLISDLKCRWNVLVQELDAETGEVISEQRTHNIVTTAGLAEIGRRVALIAPSGEDQFAAGSGDATPAVDDTALETQEYIGNISAAEGGASGSVFRFVLPSTECNGDTLTEVGLFTVDDVLIARALLETKIEKTSGKAVAFVWTWTFANAVAEE